MLWQLAKCCEVSLVVGTVDKELQLKSRVQSDSRGSSESSIAHHTQFIRKQNTDPENCWEGGHVCSQSKKKALHKDNWGNSKVCVK